MTKKPVGIVDPWRTVDLLHPTPAVKSTTPARRRINLDEIDRDADLAIPGRHVLRFQHVCFNISSTRIKTTTDAFHIISDCVADLSQLRQVAEALQREGIGVRTRGRSWNIPEATVPASTLECESSCLWFANVTVDVGTRLLARIMRSPLAAPALRQHGIIVMLASS